MRKVTMSGTPLPPGEPRLPEELDPIGETAPRDEVAQLREAVQSQRDIGVAIGLLSARYRCSTEQAWRMILRVSQDSNTKVRVVARVLVGTHDGTAGHEDRALLETLAVHLPASGWAGGTSDVE